MKKVFKYSLLAIFLGFISCDDATDITQKSELDEQVAYQSVEDLQTGLNGVYAAYGPDAGGNGSGDIILFNDLFTDNIKRGLNSSGQGNTVYNFIVQPGTSFPNTIWDNRYATINFANRLLRAWNYVTENFELSDAELQAADQIKGQALAIRALCHFELLQYFAPDYQDASAPGVIIMDFVPEVTDKLPRNTVGEVFDFVKTDLTDATALLGNFNSGDTGSPYYINTDVVKAIRARVALFEGDYTTAGTLASELVAAYPLAGAAAYKAMFVDDTESTEEIFTLARVQGDRGVVGLYYANSASIDGSPFFEASHGLVDLFTCKDIRIDVILETTGTHWDTTNCQLLTPDGNATTLDNEDNIYLIGKYRGTAAGQRINDIKLIRSSEMQLIVAETQARAGNYAGAATTIKTLRQTRLISGVVATPDYQNSLLNALRDVLLERRKELCFEGHRYLDLKRLGEEVGLGISRNELDCGSFAASCELPVGSYLFTLPIPQDETRANPTIEQNTGY